MESFQKIFDLPWSNWSICHSKCIITVWGHEMGNFLVRLSGYQKIYNIPCPNLCFYHSKNSTGVWGPVEWVEDQLNGLGRVHTNLASWWSMCAHADLWWLAVILKSFGLYRLENVRDISDDSPLYLSRSSFRLWLVCRCDGCTASTWGVTLALAGRD